MKKELKYIRLISLLLLFTACSNETDEFAEAKDTSVPFTIHVYADGFADASQPGTRATDSGSRTYFEQGDCVGVIAISSSGTPTHVSTTYNAETRSWTTSGMGTYDANSIYVPYFPYKSDLNLTGISNAATAVAAIKRQIVPLQNQQSAADYRASDLLTGSCEYSSSTLTITLKHAYSLLWLQAGTEYSTADDYVYRSPLSWVVVDYDGTPYYPYSSGDGDGCRLVVNAENATTGASAEWFYTLSEGKSYRVESSLPDAGSYHLYRNVVNGGIRAIAMGDYYYSDGGIVPGEAENPPAEGCIGIVIKAGRDESGDWIDDCQYKLKDGITPMTTIHGYVLALDDAGLCTWGPSATLVGNIDSDATGFYGYKYTQNIKAYATKNNMPLTNFPAAYYASDADSDYEKDNPTPVNSSGWFLPSFGQCIYWFNNREALLASIQKIEGKGSYAFKKYYWSSSEYDEEGSHAWEVGLQSSYTHELAKANNYDYVRAFLAF